MVSRTSKLIIINAVKHTEAHNRRCEEKDMWYQRRKEIEEGSERKERRRKHREHRKHHQSVADSFEPGGHLRAEECSNSEPDKPKASTSSKWAAELMRFEESLGEDRWGHGGYKELYPGEFHESSPQSRSSSQAADEIEVNRKKRKKKHKFKDVDTYDADIEYGPKPPPRYTISDSDEMQELPVGKNKSPKKKKKHKKHKHRKKEK